MNKQKSAAKSEYDFTLLLDADTVTNEMEESLLGGGCDDATISLRFGCVYLAFTRESNSLLHAVLSACKNVRDAGYSVRRVDACNLVTQAEIALRCKRSRQVIHAYINGKRGPGGFPPPACHIEETPMWMWCEVARWLYEHDMISEDDRDQALIFDLINSLLDFQHQKCVSPETAEEILRELGPADCECV
jgi:hypothetical protein